MIHFTCQHGWTRCPDIWSNIILNASMKFFFFFFSGEGEIKAGEKATTENEMVGWHHRLNGHEFEQAPGIGNGQEGLVCCRPWGRRVGHD